MFLEFGCCLIYDQTCLDFFEEVVPAAESHLLLSCAFPGFATRLYVFVVFLSGSLESIILFVENSVFLFLKISFLFDIYIFFDFSASTDNLKKNLNFSFSVLVRL